MPTQPCVYAHYVQDNACAFHRLLQPFRFLAPHRPDLQLVCAGDPNPAGADAYVTHGFPTRVTVERFGHWKRAGAVAIWSIDDDYESLPEWNGNKADDEDLDRIAAVRDMADLILVSTEGLAETVRARGYGGKVCVAPNLIDLEMYPTEPPPEPEAGKPVRALWSGSITHSKDLDVMAEGVAAALDALPKNSVTIAFLGGAPPHPLLRDRLHRGVVWQPPVPFAQYWDTLASYAPHVVLAPLDDCLFNRSKSSLRLIEGFALRAAVIASPVAEYANPVFRSDALLHAASPRDWKACLCDLVTDADARYNLAHGGRIEVEDRWAWQNPACHGPWHRFLDRVADLTRR